MSANASYLRDSAQPVASPGQILTAVSASCIGWGLDLFDLFVLLYVAPVVGKLFFPSEHPMLSLAGVYASFAVTLLMRPVGSAIFGSYADRHGRKRAMIIAVVGVGIATAMFGLLPTVAQVGLAAPLILIALRLVQGVFVGGVVASTHTIATESVPAKWRGLVSGMIGGGGAGLGALFASLVYLIMNHLFTGESFAVWGWRCMFFTGILSSFLGLLVFNKLEESPLWAREQGHRQAQPRAGKTPVGEVFSSKWRGVLLVNLLLTIGGGGGYYLTSGYLPTYLKMVTHTPVSSIGPILLLASVGVIVASVLTGQLSEVFGRKRTFLTVGVLRLFAFPALYLAMVRTHDVTMLGTYAILLGMLGSASYAPILIFLNERFPTAIRATGTGLSWNLGFALGGMLPTFVSLTARTPAQLPMTLAAFLVGLSVLFLIGAALVPETRGNLDAV
jgi:MFS family permease